FESAYALDGNSLSAYNLAILYGDRDLGKALEWAGIAYEAVQSDPRYVYLYAYFLYRSGQRQEALRITRQALGQGISSRDIRELRQKLESSH
ncbi:MAG: CDC27 family protein, partial [Candidatus Neomarinimicrobiota bacterium]